MNLLSCLVCEMAGCGCRRTGSEAVLLLQVQLSNPTCSIMRGNYWTKRIVSSVWTKRIVSSVGALILLLLWLLHQRSQRKPPLWPLRQLPSYEDSYDIIVMIHSLVDFAKKKRIWFLRSISSDFDPEASSPLRIIAVVGLFNKGKTFLLNKLFNLNLPHGNAVVTQGLSCVHVKERRMLLIDSPGVQATVSYLQSDGPNRVTDAQSTEGFLFELVSQLSDHVIFVVNDFTSQEQKYVQMFEQKDKEAGRAAREMIVVHNLLCTKDEAEAEKIFKRQISSRYDGVPSHLAKLCYTAKGSPVVHHLAICQDGSSAGVAFNQSNLDLLIDHLEHVKKLPNEVKLKDLVKEKMDSLLPRFMLMGAGEEERNLKYKDAKEERAAFDGLFEDFPSKHYNSIGYLSVECDVELKTEGVMGR